MAVQTTQSSSLSWRIQERTLKFNINENYQIGTAIGTAAASTLTSLSETHPSYSSNLPTQLQSLAHTNLIYKLGSPSSLFAVDEQTGVLTTIAEIDAEQLCSQSREPGRDQRNAKTGANADAGENNSPDKSFDRIQCTQAGLVTVDFDVNGLLSDGSLRAVHHIQVTINDLNDNVPIFDQVRYHRRLDEVLYRKGRRLKLPKARDADLLAEYNRILYRLETGGETPKGSTLYNIPFRLKVSITGQPELEIIEDLDAEIAAKHHLVLVAYSPGPVWRKESAVKSWKLSQEEKNEARLLIDIEVADTNDNEPKFEFSSYNVSVAEDTPPGSVIYKLIAYDPDRTAQLAYLIGSSEEPGIVLSMFKVESDGRVRLRNYMDYERRHTYNLPVQVTDGEFGAQATLVVNVLDVNDEAPVFELNPKQLVADENAAPGKLIGRIRIRDPDSAAVNGKVHCKEPDRLSRRQALVLLPDPRTNPSSLAYDLTTRISLDRETMYEGTHAGEVIIYLICTDGNDLSDEEYRLNRRRHTSTMTATLTIRDENDHQPVFDREIYHVAIQENNQIGDKVIQVHATDDDIGENAQITYSLLDQANFKVDTLTGWIMANTAFDREVRDSYQVTVVAKDQGKPRLSSTVLLNLTIIDVNDHRPQLHPYETELKIHLADQHMPAESGRLTDRNTFVVLENLPPEVYLGDILASDADQGLNSKLRFELLSDPMTQHHRHFKLLHNGSLFTLTKLDREEKDQYHLQVRVVDQSPMQPLSTTGTISVTVLDVNDNSPTFVRPNQLLALNITKSYDKYNDGSVNILYDQPTSNFDPLSNIMDKKVNENFHKSENIKDPVLSEFDHALESAVHVSMHEKPGFVITQLYAEDPDFGNNGRVHYELEAVQPQSSNQEYHQESLSTLLFFVEENKGDLILQRPLNRNDMGAYLCRVRASDNGYPRTKSDVKLLILVVEDSPAIGNKQLLLQKSSYYAGNQTLLENNLWKFGGENNLPMIIILATISGALVVVLVTSITCVMGFCSKERHSNPTGNSSRNNGSLQENGQTTRLIGPALHGTNGHYGHYGYPVLGPDLFHGTRDCMFDQNMPLEELHVFNRDRTWNNGGTNHYPSENVQTNDNGSMNQSGLIWNQNENKLVCATLPKARQEGQPYAAKEIQTRRNNNFYENFLSRSPESFNCCTQGNEMITREGKVSSIDATQISNSTITSVDTILNESITNNAKGSYMIVGTNSNFFTPIKPDGEICCVQLSTFTADNNLHIDEQKATQQTTMIPQHNIKSTDSTVARETKIILPAQEEPRINQYHLVLSGEINGTEMASDSGKGSEDEQYFGSTNVAPIIIKFHGEHSICEEPENSHPESESWLFNFDRKMHKGDLEDRFLSLKCT